MAEKLNPSSSGFADAQVQPQSKKTTCLAYLPAPIAISPASYDDPEHSNPVLSRDQGFHLRPPPSPHNLESFITPDDALFQTIHMGAVHILPSAWTLSITGLVAHPLTLTLSHLLTLLPVRTLTAFHECYGSPLVPPTAALRRIGNVRWTGVPLRALLAIAGVDEGRATHVWSSGLDAGTFGGVAASSYTKDLPLAKALQEDGGVLVAWAMNGAPLDVRRGGPVRLVVPGWFGTNSTKWLAKIEVQDRRAPGPFTTAFYNERDEEDGRERPVWAVQPNSMVVVPAPDADVDGPEIVIEGWAWSCDGVAKVDVTADEGATWVEASVEAREDVSWQRYRAVLSLPGGEYVVLALATGADGRTQPMDVGRNHVHRVAFRVV